MAGGGGGRLKSPVQAAGAPREGPQEAPGGGTRPHRQGCVFLLGLPPAQCKNIVDTVGPHAHPLAPNIFFTSEE